MKPQYSPDSDILSTARECSDPEQMLAAALGLSGADLIFPWQRRLLARFMKGDLPGAIDIPTGLGKTSVMAVWVVARAYAANLPRRLVYVVDRRAVVDQATEEALRLRDFVEVGPHIKSALGLQGKSLPVSTLRGQFVDNRQWLEDPSLPAIIVGTVDMVGSRLLFEGYRVSRKMRPYHAGLLGVDTLVVLDEAHLVQPFEGLLAAIAERAWDFGPTDESLRKIIPEFILLSLSATNRRSSNRCHTLGESDFEHRELMKRLAAPKRLILKRLGKPAKTERGKGGVGGDRAAGASTITSELVTGEGETATESKKGKDCLAEVLAGEAWALTNDGRMPSRVLIFCDKREDAQRAKAAIEKSSAGDKRSGKPKIAVDTELFVGGRRVFEREEAKARLKELGFLAGSNLERTKPAFLIATSAAEVGVDLDADHMVCDLVAWERMVQRLGRVNRRGNGDANVVVVALSEQEDAENLLKKSAQSLSPSKPKTVERIKLLCAVADVINRLPPIDGGRNASPGALRCLAEQGEKDPELRKLLTAAVTVPPLRPPLTRALVDAWSMSSLETHTGRPAIDPWLRGWLEDDRPQTAVVWRTYLPVRHGRQPTDNEIQSFFEAAPPHTNELLETETSRVIDWLAKRGLALLDGGTKQIDGCLRKDEVAAFVLTSDLKLLRRPITLEELVALSERRSDKKLLEGTLAGATLVVDARLAGLKAGLLENDEDTMPPTADGEKRLGDHVAGFRVRSAAAGVSLKSDSPWQERRRFAARVSNEGEPLEWLIIEKWRDAASTEDDRSTSRPQLLDEHQFWSERYARELATRLGLEKEYIEMLAMAARLHDEGKRAKCWQRAFRAPGDADYAKTKGPIDLSFLHGYRHEFGSFLCLGRNAILQQLPKDPRDLALHIVAAHHGFGRPVIATSGCEDAPPSVLQQRALEVALRFVRLQRRWGAWGLAWWEALLRAADQQASRENELLRAMVEREVEHG